MSSGYVACPTFKQCPIVMLHVLHLNNVLLFCCLSYISTMSSGYVACPTFKKCPIVMLPVLHLNNVLLFCCLYYISTTSSCSVACLTFKQCPIASIIFNTYICSPRTLQNRRIIRMTQINVDLPVFINKFSYRIVARFSDVQLLYECCLTQNCVEYL